MVRSNSFAEVKCKCGEPINRDAILKKIDRKAFDNLRARDFGAMAATNLKMGMKCVNDCDWAYVEELPCGDRFCGSCIRKY